jgi:hypothetical protein
MTVIVPALMPLSSERLSLRRRKLLIGEYNQAILMTSGNFSSIKRNAQMIGGNMANIETYERFIAAWKQVKPIFEPEQPQEFIDAFTRFASDFETIKNAAEQEARLYAPDFNVFHLLGVNHLELKHSAFLAHLLNPRAEHGQGVLFLKSFLDYCCGKYPDFPNCSVGRGRWIVTQEKNIGYGRIDIAIENPYLGYLVVIEVKVNALEGPTQLQRYGHWLKQNEGEYPYSALIFLSTSGYQGHSAGGYPHYCLSFQKDIFLWLYQLDERIEAVGVREVIRQYCYAIQS